MAIIQRFPPGYPITPALFILSALVIVVNTVMTQPRQSLIGLGIPLLGTPAYLWWRGSYRKWGDAG